MAQARRVAGLALLGLILVASTACGDLPRDPEGTLDRIDGGTMRVGITDNDPWTTYEDGEAEGVEVRILERFAEDLDAEIDWVPGSEADLMSALEMREVDLVVGGLTSTDPWGAKVALTHPYLTTSVVVAVLGGDEVPEDIAARRVAVERGTEQAGILEKTDATVIRTDDVVEGVESTRGALGPVGTNLFAIENWLIDDLDLEDTGVTLIETDHVMAAPLGENAWLVRLERYLLTHEDDIKSVLDEEGGP